MRLKNFHSKNLKPLIIERNTQTLSILKDIVKESIFNLILHSKVINLNLEESNILDLFSLDLITLFIIDKSEPKLFPGWP